MDDNKIFNIVMKAVKIQVGVLSGVIAGILSCVPLIVMQAPRHLELSFFLMWVIVGFLISEVDSKLDGFFKGVLLTAIFFLPVSIIIAVKYPSIIIPVVFSVVIIGGGLGWIIDLCDPDSYHDLEGEKK